MYSMDRLGYIPRASGEEPRCLKNAPQLRSRDATKKQAIGSPVHEIQTLQRQGYTAKTTAQILSDSGIPMSRVTLNSYLQLIRTEGGNAKRATSADTPKKTAPKAGESTRQPQVVPESSAASKAMPVTSRASASTTSITEPHVATTQAADPRATKEKAVSSHFRGRVGGGIARGGRVKREAA